MSLPRYVVNFDELSALLNDEMNKPDDRPQRQYSRGKQKSKGMRLETIGDKMNISDKWKITSEVWITGIKIAVSDETAWKRDKMDLIIDDEVVFEDIYLKNVSEYKNFRVFRPVIEGGIVEVVLHGNSERVEVWVDIDYIGDMAGLTVIEPPPHPAIPEPEPEPEPEPPEPEPNPEPPETVNPDDDKPPVVVCPNDTISVGEITIGTGDVGDLRIMMEFADISGASFPDMNITAPNGETFGYQGEYLNSGTYQESTESYSCSLASYTGYIDDPEIFVFKSPMAGKWTFYAQSQGGEVPSLVRFQASHPYYFSYREKTCQGFENYPLTPFPN